MEKGRWSREWLLFFFLVVFSGFSFFSDQKGWLDSVRGTAEKPILRLEEKLHLFNLSLREKIRYFSSCQETEQELMRVRGELRQLAFDQSRLSACTAENLEIRRLLGAPLPPVWQFMPAKVIGLTDKMRIDKGLKDGVREGMMVVYENILVGRVFSAEEKSALVLLPADASARIPVVIKKPLASETETAQAGEGIQARGLLESARGRLTVGRIIQSEDVKKEDLILTSGENEWLPDLLIGRVESVLEEGAAIYKKALVLPLVDYRYLTTVFIVTDY